MSKVKLAGIDRIVKNLNKTVIISKDEENKDKRFNIQVGILDVQGNIVNGITCENAIRGLIICSNYYLTSEEISEEVKNYKSKLEKLIRHGAMVKIKKFHNDGIHLALNLDGKDKYNFYGKNVIELIKKAEEYRFLVSHSL